MNYKLNDERFFADITDGIAILIEIETGVYYGLNALSSSVFENIIAGVDIEYLLFRLAEIKGWNETVKEKFDKFFHELCERGIICEDGNKNFTETHFNFSEIMDDNLDFIVSEYREAAELLLADPIHQVKKDKGWGPDKEALV